MTKIKRTRNRSFKTPFSEFKDKIKLSCWSKANKVQPHQVSLLSGKSFLFDCNQCGRRFEQTTCHVTKGSWCKFCSGRHACFLDDCQFCYEKSFAFKFPERALLWSAKNTVSPDKVSHLSQKTYIFDCICGHEIKQSPVRIGQGSTCKYCCPKPSTICGEKECVFCLPKTFASFDPEKVAQWSYEKNTIGPWQVAMNATAMCWFTCKECSHDFRAQISNVSKKTGGIWCPFCSSHSRQLCEQSETCPVCLPKTLANYSDKEKLAMFSPKNTKKPYEIFSGSIVPIIFDCKDCGNEFTTTPRNVIFGNSWCPTCVCRMTIPMQKITSLFGTLGVDYELETTIKLDNRPLHWDASCIFEGTEFFIESDGAQHFTVEGMNRVSKGKMSPERVLAKFNDQRARDLLKETYIRVNNGILFRFSYRQLSQIESLVSKMLEYVRAGKTGVVYMDTIYW